MVIRFSYKIKRGRNLPTKLRKARDGIRDRREPMNELKTYAVLRWRDNFESTGGVYGKWADLSPRSWRRGDNHNGIPLHHKGGLFRNVMSQSNRGKVTSTQVTWAFKNGPESYPLSHQFGWNPYFKQPPRVIWTMNAEDEAHAHKVLDGFVKQKVKRL